MKINLVLFVLALFNVIPFHLSAQAHTKTVHTAGAEGKTLFIDVHELGAGKVSAEDVANAHAKDLATQAKFGVSFINYWVDESKGLVYCLSSASDSNLIIKTHSEAHGLLPNHIYQVTDGIPAPLNRQKNFFLDVHYLGEGKVTANDVAEAHKKDLTVQQKHGVNFINYWVDEKSGMIMCLSQAKDSASVIDTHKESHGLVPAYILKVKQGE